MKFIEMVDCKVKFDALLGKTFQSIDDTSDTELIFKTDTEEYRMFHCQDCCENVYVESIAGDLNKLIGSPILQAE